MLTEEYPFQLEKTDVDKEVIYSKLYINKLKSKLVGVNNRNLKTMKVDISNTIKLKKFIDPDKVIVAESGLKTQTDLKLLKENGIINFLIGESLMKEKNITLATKTILGI